MIELKKNDRLAEFSVNELIDELRQRYLELYINFNNTSTELNFLKNKLTEESK